MAAVLDDSPDVSSTLTDETAAIITSFDPNILVEFLTDLAVITLNASREDLKVSLLSYPDTLQRCSRFAADSNQGAIYLKKDVGESSTQNGNLIFGSCWFSGAGGTPFVYYLSSELAAGPNNVASVSLMKRALPLDGNVPLPTQVQIAILTGPPNRAGQDAISPFENLHAFVKHTISPYFNSCTRGENDQHVRHGKSVDDAKTGSLGWYQTHIGIPLAKKKIAELELSFLHLQQNIEIPEITLPIPSVVQNALQKVVSTVTADNIGSSPGNSTNHRVASPGHHLRFFIP